MLTDFLRVGLKGCILLVFVLSLVFTICMHAQSKTYTKPELEQRLIEIELQLKSRPRDIDVLEKKIAILELLGREREAFQICENEIRAGVDRVFFWRYLGIRKFKEENWSEALFYFKKAHKKGDSISAGCIAFCLRKLDRNDECVNFSSQKIKQYPNDSALYLNRGLARRALKQSKNLVCTDLLKACELDPSVIGAYRSICSGDEASK